VLIAVFIVYLGVVAALTILPTHAPRFRSRYLDHINVIPFEYSFKCFLVPKTMHPNLLPFCLRNTLGNIALFLPLGILLPLVSKRYRSLGRVALIALCLSLTIEMIQFLSQFIGNPRSVDIDDVLLNTIGACLGLLIYWLNSTKSSTTSDKDRVLSST